VKRRGARVVGEREHEAPLRKKKLEGENCISVERIARCVNGTQNPSSCQRKTACATLKNHFLTLCIVILKLVRESSRNKCVSTGNFLVCLRISVKIDEMEMKFAREVISSETG
jgi:hypothetical protein